MRKKTFTFNQIPATHKGPAILQESQIYRDSAIHRGPIIRQSYIVRDGSCMYQNSLTKVYYDMQHEKYTKGNENHVGLYLLSGIIPIALVVVPLVLGG